MANPSIVLLPDLSSGHFMSLIEAGKRLLGHNNEEHPFSITVLVVHPPTAELKSEVAGHIRRVTASGLDIRFHHLPAVEPPMDCVSNQQEFKSRYMQLFVPHVKAAIAGFPAQGVAALIVDFYATTVFDVVRELAVPAYLYFTSTAALLALTLRLPALHEEAVVDFQELEGVVDVPGMSPLPAKSIPRFMERKNSPNYTWFVYHGNRFMEADGIIINTVAQLEPGLLAAIAEGRCVPGRPAPPLYPIGPVINLGRKNDVQHEPVECIKWLNTQPPASVVFLCFGSLGFFDAPQVNEIAVGLERSGHRFLWALRGPPAAGSHHPTDANPEEVLPEGFLERTRERGLVWPSWAPQKEILSYGAVGGFVTHCGWNSTLESLWFGVPIIPWPLYAEQHLNAFETVTEMGVAVELKRDVEKNGFVKAAELERAVRSLMGESDEGRRAREKAMEMKAACRKAVEKGGSSYAALQSLCDTIRSGAV